MAKKEKSTTPVMTDFPTLRMGDTGSYVTVAQANLINRGYDLGAGKIDGYFGEKTKAAVKLFQKSVGMAVPNGIIGPKTWEALQNAPVMQVGKIQEEVVPEAAPATEPMPDIPKQAAPNCKVIIEGLSKFQAEMIVRLFDGGFLCRII